MEQRRYPVGAEVMPDGGTHFRVWAPRRSKVAVILEFSDDKPTAVELKAETSGYFSGLVAQAKAGALYRFRLDADSTLYPDPISRFQPQGPHGPSQVVDPGTFSWSDHAWPGVPREGQVIWSTNWDVPHPKELPEKAAARGYGPGRWASRFSKSCRSRISPATSDGATTA